MCCPNAPRRARRLWGNPLTDQPGDRLRTYVESVMAERGIASVSELSRRAHVSRDTFQAWWRGRPPQRSTAELVARELGVSYGDLIAAREGQKETPAAVTEAGVSDVLRAIGRQAELVTELLVELRASRQARDELVERVEALELAARLQGRSRGAGGGVPAPRRPIAE